MSERTNPIVREQIFIQNILPRQMAIEVLLKQIESEKMDDLEIVNMGFIVFIIFGIIGIVLDEYIFVYISFIMLILGIVHIWTMGYLKWSNKK